MRTHYCGEVNQEQLEQEIQISGWVHRRRDMGGVIFIDLRDRTGLLQVVFEPTDSALFAQAERLRSEYVIHIKGIVRKRPEGMENTNLFSGQIEINTQQLEVLNVAETTPFPIDEYQNVGEEVRLRYRYLDLRRPESYNNLAFRSRAIHIIRNFLTDNGFLDIETPCLTRSTPEGARDYLVPSRNHQGQFYALPQSPQLFKQLLMVAGFDRYFQIARCFRDEDSRADRQPEFTQLDLETSFLNENQIQTIVEDLLQKLFKELLSVDLPTPFIRMPYAEAIKRFGTDRPDLRIPLELIDIDDLVSEVDFKVFAAPAKDTNSRVVALRVPNGNALSRKQIDGYGDFAGKHGAKGLAYFKINDRAAGIEGVQSPILKYLPENVVQEILERVGAQTGDVVFFGADKASIVNESMGALRVKIGNDLDLLEAGWRPLWVVDFPLFEWDEKSHRWDSVHNPFTAPVTDDPATLTADPKLALSRAYDAVLNGIELGGGSIRINKPEMQISVFKLLGMDDAQITDKFGFLIDALKYGAPPHGGLAFGLDRLIMLMIGAEAIRDVIAFPKTQNASCLMTQAPSPVEQLQLQEIGVSVRRHKPTVTS